MLIYVAAALALLAVIYAGYRNFKMLNPKLTHAEMLDLLADEGADMTAKHRFDFYIEFKSQDAVDNARALLADDVYTIEVDDEADGIIDFAAYLDMVPTVENVETHGARIEDIARQTGGAYQEYSFEVKTDPDAT